MRFPFRFGFIASFALSALAGFAGAKIGSWWRRCRTWSILGLLAICTGLLAVVTDIALRPRLRMIEIPTADRVPPVYRWLAEHGDNGPLLELPNSLAVNARAMYFSTYHWLPLLNGYTSYPPASSSFLGKHAAQLPASGSLQVLTDCAALRWILVHGPQRRQAWAMLPGVELRASFPPNHQDLIYEVLVTPRTDCGSRLFQSDTSTEGHPLVDLAELRGQVSLTGIKSPARSHVESLIAVTIENDGGEVWPATSIDPTLRVALTARWIPSGEGRATVQEILLPQDVRPGKRLVFSSWLRHPPRAASYLLRISLIQGDKTSIVWEKSVQVLARGQSS